MIQADYIDRMGTDARVVDAARVSFDKQAGEYSRDKNARLIRYLARHQHWTPFAHCVVTMRETVPLFVARQRFKHTVGFAYNEVSRRYIDSEPEFHTPEAWRARPDGGVKQGSGGVHAQSKAAQSLAYEAQRHAVLTYNSLIDQGVAPEQARMVLPQSMLTSYYVTGSLAAWARAYKLRIDDHAQLEIQQLAVQWFTIIEPLFPVAWKALTVD